MKILSRVRVKEGCGGDLNIPLGVANVMLSTWPTLPGEFPQILTHALSEELIQLHIYYLERLHYWQHLLTYALAISFVFVLKLGWKEVLVSLKTDAHYKTLILDLECLCNQSQPSYQSTQTLVHLTVWRHTAYGVA